MTGPSGDQPRGFWDVLEADPPRRLVFLDGFANDDGTPNPDFARNVGRVTIEPIDAQRTRMSIEFQYASTKAMEQYLAMGMEEGLTRGRRPDRRDPRRGAGGMTVAVATHHDTDEEAAMTTMTEPTTQHPGRPGRRPDL